MKHFKWIVEIEVDEAWVKDGFDLTDDRAKALIENDLRYSYGHETKARVIKRPNMAEINVAQGYPAEFPRAGWPTRKRTS